MTDVLNRPADSLGLKTPKTRPIQTLATYRAGSRSQELMWQVTKYEKQNRLPLLRRNPERPTARVIRYMLLRNDDSPAVWAMARHITAPQAWFTIAGLSLEDEE